MEHEEREDIPWSSLVAEAQAGPDRRLYLAAGLVGLIVVAVIGYRVVSSKSVPAPPAPIASEAMSEMSTTSLPVVVVTEEDLTTETAPEVPAAFTVRAEWFVTDFYTHDGSDATREAVRDALVADVQPLVDGLEAPAVATFVEWARAYDVEAIEGGGARVRVAYRVLETTDSGYRRLPVAFVSVTVADIDGVPRIVQLPTVDPPWNS